MTVNSVRDSFLRSMKGFLKTYASQLIVWPPLRYDAHTGLIQLRDTLNKRQAIVDLLLPRQLKAWDLFLSRSGENDDILTLHICSSDPESNFDFIVNLLEKWLIRFSSFEDIESLANAKFY